MTVSADPQRKGMPLPRQCCKARRSIYMRVSTTPSLMRMDIVRVGVVDVPMRSQFVSVGSYGDPPEAWKVGCDWPPFYSFRVPETWPSGCYRVDGVPAGGETHMLCYFVVKARQPAVPILMVFAVTTAQAYNGWPDETCYPGFSLYPSDVPTRQRLEGNGYAVEYCTSIDLHTAPAFLRKYQLLLSVGHDEYWSREMRDNVETFIGNGGNEHFSVGIRVTGRCGSRTITRRWCVTKMPEKIGGSTMSRTTV
jgi:hypothetical protein